MPWIRLSLLVAVLVSGLSCAGSGVPKDFKVVFGEGGGVTGQWRGHTIAADGQVETWAGASAEVNPKPAGKLSELALELEKSGYFEIERNEPGNMTRFIRVTANEETHEVTWPAGGSDDTLEGLLAFCREQVKNQ